MNSSTSVGRGALDRFMERLPEDVILVVDEAYVEYVRRPDFPDAVSGWLERVRPPFSVTRLAERAACAALEDLDHVDRSLRMNAEGLSYLEREIRALGYRIWPSDASFLLVRVGEGVCDALLDQGVIVRAMESFGLPDCARISVDRPEDNERCVKALRHLREGVSRRR